MIFIGDIVESNGRTVKENNLSISYNIPLGSLVEITNEDEDSGVRLFVVSHDRDCDGTPLYGLSFDKNVQEKIIKLEQELENDEDVDRLTRLMIEFTKCKISNGYSECSLTVIK